MLGSLWSKIRIIVFIGYHQSSSLRKPYSEFSIQFIVEKQEAVEKFWIFLYRVSTIF